MTAKRSARWRGSREVAEHPESPEWDFSNSEDTCVKVFEGPYAALLASKPAVGSLLANMPAGYTVDRVKVKRARSGKGTMTITLTKGSSGSDTAVDQPQYEVDWSEVQKPLEQHPIFQTSGSQAMSQADWIDAQLWEEEKDQALRKAWKYTGPSGDVYEVPEGPARVFIAKKLAGTTSYSVWIPVLRRTQLRRGNVSGATAGSISAPPGEFGTLPKQKSGADFVWFKTADRSVRSGKHGKWQRIEEWTGFDKVDTDLY